MAATVGFIGVGNMGNPMAYNVLKAPFATHLDGSRLAFRNYLPRRFNIRDRCPSNERRPCRFRLLATRRGRQTLLQPVDLLLGALLYCCFGRKKVPDQSKPSVPCPI